MKKNEISLDDLFMEWIEGTLIEDKRFAEYKEKFEDIKNNFKVIGVQKAEETIIELIHEALRKEDNIDLRYVNMWGKELYDPDFLLFGISPGDKHVAEIEDFNKLTYDINPEDTTINLINKIRTKYDIDKSLNLYMWKDSKLTQIPLYHPIDYAIKPAKWLREQNFGVNDKIIAIPEDIPSKGTPLYDKSNWDPEGPYPSPYLPKWENFIIDLGRLLESVGLISTDDTKQGLERYINQIEQLDGGLDGIYDIKYKMSTTAHKQFSVTSITLDKYFLTLEKLIKMKFESSVPKTDILSYTRDTGKYFAALQYLEHLFNYMYDISGISSEKVYTQDTRLTLKKLALYLKEKNLISSDAIKQLSEVIGYAEPASYYGQTLPEKEPHSLRSTVEHMLFNPIKFILEKNGFGIIQGDFEFSFNFGDKKKDSFLKAEKGYLEITYNFESGLKIDIGADKTLDGLIKDVFKIVGPYIDDVSDFWTLEGRISQYSDSIKKEFIRILIKAGNFYDLTIQQLSDLLYHQGSTKLYDHLTDPDKMRKMPTIGWLDELKFKIGNWDYQDFKDITGRKITMYEFVLTRESIIDEINNWIFDRGYLDDSLFKVKKDRKISLFYDIASSVKYATSMKKGSQSAISYNTLDTELGLSSGRFFTTFGGLPTSDSGLDNLKKDLEKMYHTIAKWHAEDIDANRNLLFGTRATGLQYDRTDQESVKKLYYYQKALYSIQKFCVEQNIDFSSPTVKDMSLLETIKKGVKVELIMNEYDTTYWNDKIVSSYHKVFSLCKFRGFDPITFTPLPEVKWHRHHFRAFAFRKMSSYVGDYVLTTPSIHKGQYEELFKVMGRIRAEAYVEALLNTMEELVNLKDQNGNVKKIDENDIITALKNNFGDQWPDPHKKMMQQGKQTLLDNLNEFYERGKEIEKNGHGMFLRLYYKSIYTKDFLNIKRIQLSNLLATKQDVVFLNLIYTGIKTFKF